MKTVLALILAFLLTTPAFAFNPNSVSFGGDGGDGAMTKGATTESTILYKNAQTFTQTVSTTWTPISRTVINTQATATFNGTTTLSGLGYSGGNATIILGDTTQNGAGPYGGSGGGSTEVSGGGGGGNGGAGGYGGSNVANFKNMGGGAAGIVLAIDQGSGGGAGTGDNSNIGANGGAGGGMLKVLAGGAISIAAGGSIVSNGQVGAAGGAGAAGGGGGGAAGTVYLASRTSITNSGSITTSGAAGGAQHGSASGSGGGGGAGLVILHSPSNTAGTITQTAGAAGSSASAQAPSAGAGGQILNITGTPNFPLIAAIEQYGGAMVADARMKEILGRKKPGEAYKINQRECAQMMAAYKAKDKTDYDQTCYELNNGEKAIAPIAIGDMEALKCAA